MPIWVIAVVIIVIFVIVAGGIFSKDLLIGPSNGILIKKELGKESNSFIKGKEAPSFLKSRRKVKFSPKATRRDIDLQGNISDKIVKANLTSEISRH